MRKRERMPLRPTRAIKLMPGSRPPDMQSVMLASDTHLASPRTNSVVRWGHVPNEAAPHLVHDPTERSWAADVAQPDCSAASSANRLGLETGLRRVRFCYSGQHTRFHHELSAAIAHWIQQQPSSAGLGEPSCVALRRCRRFSHF